MADRDFVSALVLAAGRGSRMGETKQLLPIDGVPMLVHVIGAAVASAVDEVVVVIGHDAAEVRSRCGVDLSRVRFVVNADYERGQSTSLVAGIDAVDPRADAVLVLLGDQPSVTSADIDRVLAADRGGGALAVRAMYGAVPGHPTLLRCELWDELRAQDGDVGAREVLARHAGRVVSVPMAASPPPDVDTPGDYAALVASRRLPARRR